VANGKSVICRVNDVGPLKKLYKKGRKIDLSKKAFETICDIRKGICKVRIEEVNLVREQ
jgi:rare lipoprotein A